MQAIPAAMRDKSFFTRNIRLPSMVPFSLSKNTQSAQVATIRIEKCTPMKAFYYLHETFS
jgi:hypothetical protein